MKSEQSPETNESAAEYVLHLLLGNFYFYEEETS